MAEIIIDLLFVNVLRRWHVVMPGKLVDVGG